MDSWIAKKLGGRDVSLLPTDELEVSVRVANCLKNLDIRTVGQLETLSEAELLRTPNFGRTSLKELKEVLGDLGVELGGTGILSIEQRMNRAMARVRAAKAAYAEAVLDVRHLAQRMVDTRVEES